MTAPQTPRELELWRAAWRAARDQIAETVMCGCANAAAVQCVRHENGNERWNLCGQARCAALEARQILRMEPPL